MSSNKTSELFKAAGGKWFLDTKALLLACPLIISTSLLTNGVERASSTINSASTFNLYSGLLLANIFALTICASLILLFSKTFFANRESKPIPFILVAFFGAAIGAIKGAATGTASWFFAVEPDLGQAITGRVLQTTLLGLWLIPALSMVAVRLEQLQEQRNALVAERVSSALKHSGVEENESNKLALSEFAAAVRYQLASLGNSANPDLSKLDYANAIRNIVAERLRPLSHQIWLQENRKTPGFSISQAARIAVTNFTTSRLIVAFIYSLTAAPSILRFVPLDEALARAFAAGVVIYISFALAGLVRAKNDALAVLWFLLVCLATAIATFLTGQLLFGYVAEFSPFETILAVWIWLSQLSFVSSFLVGVRKNRRKIDSELVEIYGEKSLERAVRITQAQIQNKDFANFLHGRVQNRLLSVALGLERSTATKDEIADALVAIEKILNEASADFDSPTSDDLERGLSKIAMSWNGFVDVSFNIQGTVANMSARQKSLVLQVVEEAVSNSVRHGLAKVVNISINLGDSVLLQIADDGTGPRNGKPGLGSKFFNSVSAGKWKLEHQQQGGSLLRVEL